MNSLHGMAIRLGASDFGESSRKGKRFYVVFQDKVIHFGSDVGLTYYDVNDETRRRAWFARHTRITDSQGKHSINNPLSGLYWSARLLW